MPEQWLSLILNASDDNPAILADQICSLPNANFDPIHLVITFEALGLARVTALLGESVMNLMWDSSLYDLVCISLED